MIKIIITILLIKKIILFKHDLYLPPKIILNLKDSKIPLFKGISLNEKNFTNKIYFQIDFAFRNILLSSDEICDPSLNCEITDEYSKIGYYNGKKYFYKIAKTFIGLNHLKNDIYYLKKNFKNYFHEKIRLLENKSQINKNIIGLSPNSLIWQYWQNLYNFQKNRIHLIFSNHKHYNKIILFNLPIFKNDIWIDVKKNENEFNFQGTFILKTNYEFKEKIKICLKYENDLFFEIKEELFILLKLALCKNVSKCENKNDLKNDNFFFKIVFYDKHEQNKSLNIYTEDMYRIDKENKIHWLFKKIEKNKNSHYDFILQKKFFSKFLLRIINNFQKDFIQISFEEVNWRIYIKNTGFHIFCYLFVGISSLLFFSYFFCHKFLIKKKIKQVKDLYY